MSARSDDFWQDVSYVQMSKNRKQILKLLYKADRPLTPTELSAQMQVAFNSASRAVRQLAGHELVICLNPNAPRYRRYRLTERGREVWQTIQDIEEDR